MSGSEKMATKNAHAVRLLTAWFRACMIEARPEKGADHDLVLTTASDTELRIQVPETGTDAVADETFAIVPAKLITGRSREAALRAFHAVTEAAGYGSPIPVDRGPEPDQRLHFTEEFWDVVFRHRELHRAPNPDPQKFKRYKTIIDRACWRFIRMNPTLCAMQQWGFEDVRTIAQVWCVNYFGHHEIHNPAGSDNERMLTSYLHQRFTELYKLMTLKGRSQTPDAETFQIAAFGRPVDVVAPVRRSSDQPAWQGDQPVDQADPRPVSSVRCPTCESVDMSYDQDTESLECGSCGNSVKESDFYADGGRRSEAQPRAAEVLDQHFASMPHDEMIRVLLAAANNEYIAPDARKAAWNRLNRHRRTCQLAQDWHPPLVTPSCMSFNLSDDDEIPEVQEVVEAEPTVTETVVQAPPARRSRLAEADLSERERTVLQTLRTAAKPMQVREIAACFTGIATAEGTYQHGGRTDVSANPAYRCVLNSLRRLVAGGFVTQTGRGSYAAKSSIKVDEIKHAPLPQVEVDDRPRAGGVMFL